jgi:redox-sensitive bicupin YhaK (pirin superfamily)
MVTVIDHRPAASRPRTDAEGRTTWHSFSFGAHYDPANTGLGALVAHNEEVLPPGTGYAPHHHAGLEIVTWVLQGALRHSSPVGEGVVRPGQVQRLRAGSGVEHAEVAAADDEDTVFLQVWLRPDHDDLEPAYATAEVASGPGWTCVAGADGVVDLACEGTSLHVADLAAGDPLALPDAALLHVAVPRGRVLLAERVLGPGDTARLTDEGGRQVRAEQDAQVLVWSLRAPARRG